MSKFDYLTYRFYFSMLHRQMLKICVEVFVGVWYNLE